MIFLFGSSCCCFHDIFLETKVCFFVRKRLDASHPHDNVEGVHFISRRYPPWN